MLLGYTCVALQKWFETSPDVLELWGGPGWLSCLLLSVVPGRKCVLVARSNGLEPHYSQVLRRGRSLENKMQVQSAPRGLAEIGYRRCDLLTVVSRFDHGYAIARCYKNQNLVIAIENPLGDDWLSRSICFERERTVGFVGIWNPNKGSLIMPKVIEEVLSIFADCRFQVIGIGEDAATSLRSKFPNDDRLEIIPSCSRADLKHFYENMSILLVPSIFESFGLVTAEAMSCGVAIVATPVGFAAGLNEDEEFVMISELTSASVADRVIGLLKDEQLRQAIARQGFQRVQSLRWHDAISRLEQKYRELLRVN